LGHVGSCCECSNEPPGSIIPWSSPVAVQPLVSRVVLSSIELTKQLWVRLTQQFFFSSSDVNATTCFDHSIVIRRQTVEYCRKRFA
jgi:hypothetical protein